MFTPPLRTRRPGTPAGAGHRAAGRTIGGRRDQPAGRAAERVTGGRREHEAVPAVPAQADHLADVLRGAVQLAGPPLVLVLGGTPGGHEEQRPAGPGRHRPGLHRGLAHRVQCRAARGGGHVEHVEHPAGGQHDVGLGMVDPALPDLAWLAAGQQVPGRRHRVGGGRRAADPVAGTGPARVLARRVCPQADRPAEPGVPGGGRGQPPGFPAPAPAQYRCDHQAPLPATAVLALSLTKDGGPATLRAGRLPGRCRHVAERRLPPGPASPLATPSPRSGWAQTAQPSQRASSAAQ